MPSSPRSRRLHWAAPFVVAAVIGMVALVPTLSAGAAAPNLAPASAAKVLAKVRQANVQHLSGTIELVGNLGIPNLSALSGAAGGDSAFNPSACCRAPPTPRSGSTVPTSRRSCCPRPSPRTA